MEIASRSPVLQAFDGGRFEMGAVNGMQIALAQGEAVTAAGFIADLSAVHKRLFVGAGARRFLEAHDIEAPADLLRWWPLGEDGAVVYLHHHRFLVVAPSGTTRPGPLFAIAPGSQDDTLVLHHEAADFALGGEAADAIVRELCPMNLAASSDGVWIATQLAHCNVAVRRMTTDAVTYRLMCAPADAAFLFGVLVEVVQENGGTIAGFNDYLELLEGGASR